MSLFAVFTIVLEHNFSTPQHKYNLQLLSITVTYWIIIRIQELFKGYFEQIPTINFGRRVVHSILDEAFIFIGLFWIILKDILNRCYFWSTLRLGGFHLPRNIGYWTIFKAFWIQTANFYNAPSILIDLLTVDCLVICLSFHWQSSLTFWLYHSHNCHIHSIDCTRHCTRHC